MKCTNIQGTSREAMYVMHLEGSHWWTWIPLNFLIFDAKISKSQHCEPYVDVYPSCIP